MPRLLIMSCGQRKRPDAEPLPALQRYDGPPFHVLRRYLATHPGAPLDVFILSAKFGLMPASQPIPTYDQRMTPERARELVPTVRATLAGLMAAHAYDAVYLAVGRDYLAALEGCASMAPPPTDVVIAGGSQGRRLAELHDWLYGAPPAPRRTALAPSAGAVARMRGVSVTLTRAEVLDRARAELEAHDDQAAGRYQAWYVALDGRRVAPKWLAGLITGLPATAFTTDDARRLLDQLGIAVRRA